MIKGRHLAAPAAILLLASALGLSGCYTGSARDTSPGRLSADPGWSLVERVPFVRQNHVRDCGAAALSMILGYWQVPVPPDEIAAKFPGDTQGLRAGHLRDLARERGFEAYLFSGDFRDLAAEIGRGHPVLVGVAKPYGTKNLTHYEVVVGIHREKKRLLTLDPAKGWRENSFEGFAREWVPTKQVTLVVFPRPAVATAPPATPAAR